MPRIGFVGLGVMGAPIAGHLLEKGHDLTVWNRTASKAEPLKSKGAHVANSLEGLASNTEIIFLCVSRTEDVRECLEQMSNAEEGTLFIDHSTILPEGAKEIHQNLKARGHRFIDAPMTGGSMGAQKGTLTIFCGGEEKDIQEAKPVMSSYAKRVERVGGPSAGQLTKVANQIAVAGSVLALCESLSVAEKAGLDVAQIRDLLSSGAAGSWSFDNYGPKILARDWSPGFKVKDHLKDLEYCIETARTMNAAVPGTELMKALLTEAVEEGNAEKTNAVLFETLLNSGFGS